MQAAINPALAAAMTLEQAAQVGEFSPVTKDGTPTVVGGKLQQALQPMMPQGMPGMPQTAPGVRNAAQQAGLGGQIQAMQMQEAQKAMMNAAMQQAKGPAGIEGLNPQVGRFAEGGIVGYAEAGTVASMLNPEQYALEVEMLNAEAEARRAARLRRDEAERLAFLETAAPEVAARLKAQQVVKPAAQEERVAPPPPPSPAPAVERQPSAARPSGGVGIEELANRQRAIYQSMTGPSTPEDAIAYELKRRPAIDAYMRSQGVDPNYIEKRLEEDKTLTEQQRALLRERMERERGRDTFLGRMGEALRGFSQMKGQGIGSGLTRSYDALSRRLEAGESRMDQMRDFEIKLNELEINRRRSLEDAKRATMEGRIKDAEQSLNNANAFGNEIKKLTAATYPNQIQQMVEERKIAEAAAGRAETAAGRQAQAAQTQLLAAQGRVTEAEKVRAGVVEKNKTFLALPKDTKDPMTKQLRETAENEVRQADQNVNQARTLYNSMLNQTLGIQSSAGVKTAVNPQTGQRIMSTDGGKTWQPAR